MNIPFSSLKNCLLFLSVMILVSCSSTSKSGSSNQNPNSDIVDSGYKLGAAKNANQSNIMVHPNEEKPSNLSLTDLLQRLPGVRVKSGSGAFAKFVVDGASASFMSDTSPLFVVNGMAMGTDYSNVCSLVYPNDVISMSVLKGADASIYGTRGANGVILIRTK